MRTPDGQRIYNLSEDSSLAFYLPWLAKIREDGFQIVATNGCFDVFHSGHSRFIQEASLEAAFLIIGLNDDAGVRTLKGASRPINKAEDRAAVLAALWCVDAVVIFPGTKATTFLEYTRPNVYVKSGYTLETLDPEEQAAVIAGGGTTKILPLHEGYSTTKIIERINK